MAQLDWTGGDGANHYFQLLQPGTIIGRKDDAQITIDNQYVSRHHAAIIRTGDGYFLIDLGSAHGTYVNGERISHHWLAHGERIELGKDRIPLQFSTGTYSEVPSDHAGFPKEAVAVLIQAHRRQVQEHGDLSAELAFAQETQRALLPEELPTVEYLCCKASSKPARHVCGDFYDLIFDGDEAAVVLGDVSGKGVAAALLGATLLGCLQVLLRSGEKPEFVSAKLNGLLCDKTRTGQFATMFLITIKRDGTGSYVSAGHNPAYLFRARREEIEELSSNSIFLGAFRDAPFVATGVELEKGDVLVIYSDGLPEAQNSSGEMFGSERMKDLICRQAPNGATRIHTCLLEAIDDFVQGQLQSDDMTLFVIERN